MIESSVNDYGKTLYNPSPNFQTGYLCKKCYKNLTVKCPLFEHSPKHITKCTAFYEDRLNIYVPKLDINENKNNTSENSINRRVSELERSQNLITGISEKVDELIHYQNLLMGREIGMAGVWDRFNTVENDIYKIKNKIRDDKKMDTYKLKTQINQIKEFRKRLVKKVREIYKSDSAFQGSCGYINKKFIKYIATKENLILKEKKGKIKEAEKEYHILKHLDFTYDRDIYFDGKKLGLIGFWITETDSQIWADIEKVLEIFIKWSETYLIEKYQKDLINLTGKTQKIICRQCGNLNPVRASYCFECGKEL